MLIENTVLRKFIHENDLIFSHLPEKMEHSPTVVFVIPWHIIQDFGVFYKSSDSPAERITSETQSKLIAELRIGKHLIIATQPQYIEAEDEILSVPLDIFRNHALLYSRDKTLSQAIELPLKAPRNRTPTIWFPKKSYLKNPDRIHATKEYIESLLNDIIAWDYKSIDDLEPLVNEIDKVSEGTFVTRNILDDRMDLETIRSVIAPPSVYPLSGKLPINRAIDMHGNGIYYGDDTKPVSRIKEAVPSFTSLPPINHYFRQVLCNYDTIQYYCNKTSELLVVFENGTMTRTGKDMTTYHPYIRDVTKNLDFKKTLDIRNEYKYNSQKIIAVIELDPYPGVMEREWLSYSINSYPENLPYDEQFKWVKKHISQREYDNVLQKLMKSYNSPAEEKLKLLEEKGYPEYWSISMSRDPNVLTIDSLQIPRKQISIPTTIFDFE